MAGSSYKADPNFFRKLAIGREIRAALREVGEKAKGIAEGLAQDFRLTGEYAESFDVSEETIVDWKGRYKVPRAAVRVENGADYAAAVEWGYQGRSAEETTSAHRVLGRTLDALGE